MSAVLAREIVNEIFADASGRSGVLDGIDRETLDEIRNAWIVIAQKKLATKK